MNNPSDSRIHIRFCNKKNPVVNFKYPTKQSAFGAAWIILIGVWMELLSGLMLLFFPIIAALMIFGYVAPQILAIVSMNVIFFPPFIAAIIFSKNKKLLKMLPNLATRKWFLFPKSYNFVRIIRPKSKKIVIPSFDNVMMDFRSTGDFKKYMKTMEIREQNFKHWRKPWFKKAKVRKVAEVWTAEFTFTRIPKRGSLEVRYI